jgi:hypothetical protein
MTGRNYLDALGGVLGLAVDSELLEPNPVDGMRGVPRGRNRTQKGRAENDPTGTICPIEDREELESFVEASRDVGGAHHMVDLRCLEAGLRLGEATTLRREDCLFGCDADDTSRSIRVQASRSQGTHLGKTKSGS